MFGSEYCASGNLISLNPGTINYWLMDSKLYSTPISQRVWQVRGTSYTSNEQIFIAHNVNQILDESSYDSLVFSNNAQITIDPLSTGSSIIANYLPLPDPAVAVPLGKLSAFTGIITDWSSAMTTLVSSSC